MKKIASALLLLSVLTSNTNAEGHFSENKGKYISGGSIVATLAAVGTAIAYDKKYNNSEHLEAARAFLAKHRKEATYLIAGIIGVTGLGTTGYYGYKKDVPGQTTKWVSKKYKSLFPKGTGIENLNLGSSIIEKLKKAGYKTIESLPSNPEDLTSIPGIGTAISSKVVNAAAAFFETTNTDEVNAATNTDDEVNTNDEVNSINEGV